MDLSISEKWNQGRENLIYALRILFLVKILRKNRAILSTTRVSFEMILAEVHERCRTRVSRKAMK